jgi:ankyrin repeat protein
MQLILNKIDQQEKHWLIDEKKEDGFGALHLACLNNYHDIVKLFLDNGNMNINLKNSNQQTPLHLAVERLNYDIVKLLLNFKPPSINSQSTSNANLSSTKLCNVNAMDKENDTPLHCLLRNLTILQLKKLKELNEKDSSVSFFLYIKDYF